MNITTIIKLQYEALHCWPGVVSALPQNPEIHFLQHPHRHIFHITLEKDVSHEDRDLEIILFKRAVLAHLTEYYRGDLGGMSCEHLATYLLNKFQCRSVEVLEDNENGGKVYA
jgi:hypothetical protein